MFKKGQDAETRKKPSEALVAYNRTIKEYPGCPSAMKAEERIKAFAEAKAAAPLKLAEDVEKTGRTISAIACYRQVVKDHPGTKAATKAAERIKALGGH